jgi:hypothetical protein
MRRSEEPAYPDKPKVKILDDSGQVDSTGNSGHRESKIDDGEVN